MADDRKAIDPAEMVETVKIEDKKAPGGFVVINADEFDAKKHKKHVDKDDDK